jgi:hypothetical protein
VVEQAQDKAEEEWAALERRSIYAVLPKLLQVEVEVTAVVFLVLLISGVQVEVETERGLETLVVQDSV